MRIILIFYNPSCNILKFSYLLDMLILLQDLENPTLSPRSSREFKATYIKNRFLYLIPLIVTSLSVLHKLPILPQYHTGFRKAYKPVIKTYFNLFINNPNTEPLYDQCPLS